MSKFCGKQFNKPSTLVLLGLALALFTIYFLTLSMALAQKPSSDVKDQYVFTSEWGKDTGAHEGEFRTPVSVTVDAKSQVYVADLRNHRIQQFDSSGRFLNSWGDPNVGAK